MNPLELRDPVEARQFLVQGLWWQRIQPVRAETVANILDEALALAAEGHPLPPLGLIADVGHMIFQAASPLPHDSLAMPVGLNRLLQAYEDYVLGKLFADSAFARAADALHRYQGNERLKGLAFLLHHLLARIGLTGVLLSPGLLKELRAADPERLLAEGWESLQQEGALPLLVSQYEALIQEIRKVAEVLGPEDVFELERKTAVAPFSQRLALRQVVQAARVLEDALPRRPPRTLGQRHEVPTRLLEEEDTYPVGGFSSLSTRGSIESLLHSQLAFMESGERPDLFDIKFLRDELLYYARDENNFLRRRRIYVFALYPALIQARYKDAHLPYQRIVLLLALLMTVVRKLLEWLNSEALVFEFVLLGPELDAEKELLEVLLAEQRANGTAIVTTLAPAKLAEHCAQRRRRSQCYCLIITPEDELLGMEAVAVSRLLLAGPVLALSNDDEPTILLEAESNWQGWTMAAEQLLLRWI